ncbi:MAG: hypothetical protein ACREBG_00005, partial [Pyrinomonadaceae bacterium]
RRADVRIRVMAIWAVVLSFSVLCVSAQQPVQTPVEQQVPLTESAIALDIKGTQALEGRLRTTALNGAPDTPITNINLIIKNVSPLAYSYVSGVVTFYDNAQIRCGEGMFRADALLPGESFEADTPGIRVRCAPASWRIVATNLLPRLSPGLIGVETIARPANLIISVDGEEHPIQLDKPMVLNLGERQRTIIVRQSP